MFAGIAAAAAWRVPLAVGGFALHAATVIALFGAAPSLGGPSGLLWGSVMLRGRKRSAGGPADGRWRGTRAVVLALVAALAFVAALSPGLRSR